MAIAKLFVLHENGKIKMDHWCQYASLSSQSRSQRFLDFQRTENVGALWYEKGKNLRC